MKLVCMSFSCFSSFVHETKTRFSRWGVSVVDDDVQCFPGGHLYPPGVLFRVRGHRNACNLYRFG